MAILLANTFEAGVASGTAVSTTNSNGPAGNAFTTVQAGFIYDNTQVLHGTLSVKYTQASTPANTTAQWYDLFAATDLLYGRCYVYLTANPGTDFNFLSIGTAATGIMASVIIETTGKLRTQDSSPTFAAHGTMTNAMTLNAWNRIEFKWEAGASGKQTFRLYSGDSTTYIEELVGTTGPYGSQVTRVRWGMATAANANYAYWADDFAFSESDWLGPSIPVGPSVPVKSYPTQRFGPF